MVHRRRKPFIAAGFAVLLAAVLPLSGAKAQDSTAPQAVPPQVEATEPHSGQAAPQPVAPVPSQPAPQIHAPELAAAQAGAARADIPHDLSPVGMFMAADWVVKSVMTALALASLATWTILIAKTLQLSTAKAGLRRGLKALTQARSLAEAVAVLGGRRGTVSAMVRAAAEEVKLSEPALDHAGNEGVKERVTSALTRLEVRAGRAMTGGTGMLATIGSIGPFVGLFGTVWGIMNSFIGISQAQTTNLAVVAPGIAEALLATAIGLVAAIPAVVVYNIFARAVTGYRQQLVDAAAVIERLVSRDLDFRKLPAEVKAARLKVVTE